MRNAKPFIAILFVLTMVGCTAVKPEEAIVSTAQGSETSSSNVLHTTMGDLTIRMVWLTNKVNTDTAADGEQILLIELGDSKGEAFTPENISLEEFQSMVHDTANGEIHILGDDGKETISTMAGWLQPDFKKFVMGFRLPSATTSYELFWPGNDPIVLNPDEAPIE